MKPVIGITPSPSHDEMPHGSFLRHCMAAAYVDAVLSAGGIPIVLPPQEDHTDALLDRVDGLLLSGGGDLEPSRYGATNVHETTYGISRERDQFEIDLVRKGIARDVPIFGICRGIQVLNVALGGSLVQDVASALVETAVIGHRQHEAGLRSDEIGHDVRLAEDSLLTEAYGDRRLGVNSFHHQAIDGLAPGLEAVGWSADGLIEAVTMPASSFCVAVQWHPELMFVHHPEQLALFAALVAAARKSAMAATAR